MPDAEGSRSDERGRGRTWKLRGGGLTEAVTQATRHHLEEESS